MKHLKKYEFFEDKKFDKKLLSEYTGLVYIISENDFNRDRKFGLIFVDKVLEVETGIGKQYEILAESTFQRFEYYKGETYSYDSWDQVYNEDEFKKIKFMTIEEFYQKYTESFIQILNITLDNVENNRMTDHYKIRFYKVLDKLTIPEVEHIINSRKYNL